MKTYLIILFCLLAGTVFGQVLTGVISGTITDPSGAIIPGAAVTIVNEGTGVTAWRGPTNESGIYRGPSLPVGRYKVIVEL